MAYYLYTRATKTRRTCFALKELKSRRNSILLCLLALHRRFRLRFYALFRPSLCKQKTFRSRGRFGLQPHQQPGHCGYHRLLSGRFRLGPAGGRSKDRVQEAEAGLDPRIAYSPLCQPDPGTQCGLHQALPLDRPGYPSLNKSKCGGNRL